MLWLLYIPLGCLVLAIALMLLQHIRPPALFTAWAKYLDAKLQPPTAPIYDWRGRCKTCGRPKDGAGTVKWC
jgi:hypothetical protein